MSNDEASQFVSQLQQAHYIAASFYQRILPHFDYLAYQSMEADFWYWEPSETSRPCRSTTRPSDSWAWDYLPLFASNHVYRNWGGDTAQKNDTTLAFRLYIDDEFLCGNTQKQPDPLKLKGKAMAEIILFRCQGNSDKHFNELWLNIPWPAHNPEWQQSEVCDLLEVCAKHVPLADLLADSEIIIQWIKLMLGKLPILAPSK